MSLFLCLQLSGLAEQGALRFPALLKVSAIEHVLTHVIPVPLPATARAEQRHHVWDFGDEGAAHSLEVPNLATDALTLKAACIGPK